jgi:RNA polymerase sigma-70 factor (ECF subfamily)
MKYEYITRTGKTEIEVDKEFYDILISLDNEEYNLNRKHSRRWPVSLENADYEGEWFADGTDLLSDLIQTESNEQLHKALLQLTPDQQRLIERVYFKNEKIVRIAEEHSVSEAAIRDRLKKIYARLKKFLN